MYLKLFHFQPMTSNTLHNFSEGTFNVIAFWIGTSNLFECCPFSLCPAQYFYYPIILCNELINFAVSIYNV